MAIARVVALLCLVAVMAVMFGEGMAPSRVPIHSSSNGHAWERVLIRQKRLYEKEGIDQDFFLKSINNFNGRCCHPSINCCEAKDSERMSSQIALDETPDANIQLQYDQFAVWMIKCCQATEDKDDHHLVLKQGGNANIPECCSDYKGSTNAPPPTVPNVTASAIPLPASMGATAFGVILAGWAIIQ